MIRTSAPQNLIDMAEHATVPVINGLTDDLYPCQIMADVMTFEEHRGPIADKTIAWCGDGNNMATSWIQAATLLDFELRLACPEELEPDENVMRWAAENSGIIHLTNDPGEAVTGADCVSTDVWVSMGDDQASVRHDLLRPYQVDAALMSKANPDLLFMHCLPAHRGEEVTTDVMDGPQSVVWDEAGEPSARAEGYFDSVSHVTDASDDLIQPFMIELSAFAGVSFVWDQSSKTLSAVTTCRRRFKG